MSIFQSESKMVDRVIELLASGASPWKASNTATEFDYCNGRTDVIALLKCNSILALEAKLTRWRDALHQAYRNSCFAHQSLVVLPWAVAEVACAHRDEFQRRGVGLCGVKDDQVVIMILPSAVEPLLPHVTTRAMAALDGPVA